MQIRSPHFKSKLTHQFVILSHNKDDFLKLVDQMFKNGHVESAPPLSEQEERWYLTSFGVYHCRGQ